MLLFTSFFSDFLSDSFSKHLFSADPGPNARIASLPDTSSDFSSWTRQSSLGLLEVHPQNLQITPRQHQDNVLNLSFRVIHTAALDLAVHTSPEMMKSLLLRSKKRGLQEVEKSCPRAIKQDVVKLLCDLGLTYFFIIFMWDTPLPAALLDVMLRGWCFFLPQLHWAALEI